MWETFPDSLDLELSGLVDFEAYGVGEALGGIGRVRVDMGLGGRSYGNLSDDGLLIYGAV